MARLYGARNAEGNPPRRVSGRGEPTPNRPPRSKAAREGAIDSEDHQPSGEDSGQSPLSE
jgi:hypothetical protein